MSATNATGYRTALYRRISTDQGKQDADNQRLQLRRICEVQSWEIVTEYEDHESGGKADRAQFRRMMLDASSRKWDLLVFWSLDRFTREGTLATLKYLEQLEGCGIRWRSLMEPWIDSAGPFRDVVIALLASLANRNGGGFRSGCEPDWSEPRRKARDRARPSADPDSFSTEDEPSSSAGKARAGLPLPATYGLTWPQSGEHAGRTRLRRQLCQNPREQFRMASDANKPDAATSEGLSKPDGFGTGRTEYDD